MNNILSEVKIIWYVILKDIKTYYLKPPILGWGLLFPLAFILAVIIKHPGDPLRLLPGLIGMVALFGATTMEVIVITFEKRMGSFERLLLAPISVPALVLAKILSGVIFSLLISLLAIFSMSFFFKFGIECLVTFLFALLCTVFTFASFGAFISFSVKEVYEAQLITNLIRFPMLFLCGVFFPISSLPQCLKIVSYVLPLTYAVDFLKIGMISKEIVFNVPLDAAVLIFFSISSVGLSIFLFKKRAFQ